jgi:hypothetical protein
MSRERSDEPVADLGAGLGHKWVEHATADGLKLGHFTGLPTVKFQHACPFIKHGEPIFGARSAMRWSQDGDYFRLMPLQIIENGCRGRGGCLQHQMVAFCPNDHS